MKKRKKIAIGIVLSLCLLGILMQWAWNVTLNSITAGILDEPASKFEAEEMGVVVADAQFSPSDFRQGEFVISFDEGWIEQAVESRRKHLWGKEYLPKPYYLLCFTLKGYKIPPSDDGGLLLATTDDNVAIDMPQTHRYSVMLNSLQKSNCAFISSGNGIRSVKSTFASNTDSKKAPRPRARNAWSANRRGGKDVPMKVNCIYHRRR